MSVNRQTGQCVFFRLWFTVQLIILVHIGGVAEAASRKTCGQNPGVLFVSPSWQLIDMIAIAGDKFAVQHWPTSGAGVSCQYIFLLAFFMISIWYEGHIKLRYSQISFSLEHFRSAFLLFLKCGPNRNRQDCCGAEVEAACANPASGSVILLEAARWGRQSLFQCGGKQVLGRIPSSTMLVCAVIYVEYLSATGISGWDQRLCAVVHSNAWLTLRIEPSLKHRSIKVCMFQAVPLCIYMSGH